MVAKYVAQYHGRRGRGSLLSLLADIANPLSPQVVAHNGEHQANRLGFTASPTQSSRPAYGALHERGLIRTRRGWVVPFPPPRRLESGTLLAPGVDRKPLARASPLTRIWFCGAIAIPSAIEDTSRR